MTMINSFDGEYRFLSNFYSYKIEYEGLTYPSTENAFQAAKTLDQEERKLFTDITPGHAKRLGKKVSLRPDWEEVKLVVMYDLLWQKFQDPELRKWLLVTSPLQLIEGNTWGDTFWGVCDGAGQNWLGYLLMKVRKNIESEFLEKFD